MKKYIVLFLLFGGIVSTTNAQIKIQGTVKHYKGECLTLSYYEGKHELIDTLQVGKSGKFVYQHDQHLPASLSVMEQKTPLYLEPGDQFSVVIDLKKEGSERVIFKGDRLAENNYQYAMSQLASLQEELVSGEYVAFKDYQKKLDEKARIAQERLEKVADEQIREKWTRLQNVIPLYMGLDYYGIVHRVNPDKVVVDPDFTTFVQSIDLNDRNRVDYNVIFGVINWYLDKADKTDTRDRSIRYLERVEKMITDRQIRNEHATAYMNWRLKGKKVTNMQEVFDKYKTVCTDTASIAACQEKLNVYLNYFKIRNGIEAPDFEMVDVNGQKYRLSDFRGKMVYIDVWATWCAPCKAEIPHVAALHEEFKNDDRIVFISISVDTRAKVWKKMVEEKNLAWQQFIVEGGTNSFFYKQYAIEFIPRFMLIDKNGIIVEVDYMKPSVLGCANHIKSILDK